MLQTRDSLQLAAGLLLVTTLTDVLIWPRPIVGLARWAPRPESSRRRLCQARGRTVAVMGDRLAFGPYLVAAGVSGSACLRDLGTGHVQESGSLLVPATVAWGVLPAFGVVKLDSL